MPPFSLEFTGPTRNLPDSKTGTEDGISGEDEGRDGRRFKLKQRPKTTQDSSGDQRWRRHFTEGSYKHITQKKTKVNTYNRVDETQKVF